MFSAFHPFYRRSAKVFLVTFGTCLFLFGAASHADNHSHGDAMEQLELSNGSVIGATCMGCHGFKGMGSGSIPRLAGLPTEVTAGKLMAYKSDALEGTVMNRIAKGYTDEEIQAVSEVFANQ